MKILQLIPVFAEKFGGTVSVVKTISAHLSVRHEVVVLTTTALDQRCDCDSGEIILDGYKVVYASRNFAFLNYGLFGQVNISIEMLSWLDKNLKKFDIVHVHSWQQFPDIVLHHFSKKNGVPYVLQLHGSLANAGKIRSLKHFYNISFGQRVLKDASMVVALSNDEVNQYLYHGIPPEKIALIPNSLSMANLQKSPRKGAFKKRYKIDGKMILYLGRIHESKGLDLLLTSYTYLSKKMSDTPKLIIAGPDDGYLEKAQKKAIDLGIVSEVQFIGFLTSSEKAEALCDADVFVTPTFYGFPVTFLEACAMGVPIVTTNYGDYLDWINAVGIITEPTPKDLANGIYLVLSDERLKSNFSDNCKRLSLDFSDSIVCKKIDRLYSEILLKREK
jgi:glycosyltransferase involved in cell wall biosynthesis